MNRLKVNDEVVVLSGKDKGKKGKILKLNWKTNRAMVDGVSSVKKSVKPSQQDPNGGFKEKMTGIHVSKLSLVSPKLGKPTRISIKIENGKRVRVLKKCGTLAPGMKK